jgi:hypothetical protein
VRPHLPGQQSGGDGKIFVVRPRQRFARPICARERLGPEGHRRILTSVRAESNPTAHA